MYVCFEQTKHSFKGKTTVAPYPIRSDLRQAAVPYHNPIFSKNRLTIFVQGGSQGSQGINTLIEQMIQKYPDLATKIQIIHQAGPEYQSLVQFYKTAHIPAYVFAYDHAIAQYYLAADSIICRSGAGTLFEAVFFKKPCLTIPLESAGGAHQLENAVAMSKAYPSLITIIRQGKTSPEAMYSHLTALYQSLIL